MSLGAQVCREGNSAATVQFQTQVQTRTWTDGTQVQS